MKIAIVGTRGIPACYGGFETMAEELAIRLTERGHRATVYCRSHYTSRKLKKYRGVHLVVLPTIRHKYLDTVVHTFLSILHCLLCDYQVILICNSVNALFSSIPRLFGIKVIVSVDGLERQRQKWNWLGKAVYYWSEWLTTFFPNEIVSDSYFIQSYYKNRYGKESTYIAYGGDQERVEDTDILQQYGLRKGRYLLFTARLEPENNAHRVVKAFEKLRTELDLVILGDAPYACKYIRDLKATTDSRIKFLGAIYGRGYRQIVSHCYFSVRASEVGGTHPAILEAMGCGKCILSSDNPQNRETISDGGEFFRINDEHDLVSKLQYLIDHPGEVKKFGEKARCRVEHYYSWDKVVSEYESLFERIVARSRRQD